MGGPGLALPVLAEVEELHEPLGGVREAPLVDDHAGVHRPVEHRRLDPGEDDEALRVRVGEREREEQVGGGVAPRDRHRHAPRVEPLDPGARDEERPDADAEGAAGLEEGVAAGDARQHAVADLADVEPSLARPLVERLDVLEHGVEAEPARVDAAVDEGVEDERVVGTGGEAERESHVVSAPSREGGARTASYTEGRPRPREAARAPPRAAPTRSRPSGRAVTLV